MFNKLFKTNQKLSANSLEKLSSKELNNLLGGTGDTVSDASSETNILDGSNDARIATSRSNIKNTSFVGDI